MNEGHVYRTLDPLKDIEAVHPDNAGLLALGQPRFVPSTPSSVFWMLDRYVEETGRDPKTFYNGLDLVLVGRSNNVGKPALWLGLARNATVISAHHYTAQAGRLEQHTRDADILVVAAGVPRLVTGEIVKPGAIVIDVGINPLERRGDGQGADGRRRRHRVGGGGGGGGLARPRRRRPDHGRDAARQHRAGGEAAGAPARGVDVRVEAEASPTCDGTRGWLRRVRLQPHPLFAAQCPFAEKCM